MIGMACLQQLFVVSHQLGNDDPRSIQPPKTSSHALRSTVAFLMHVDPCAMGFAFQAQELLPHLQHEQLLQHARWMLEQALVCVTLEISRQSSPNS